VIELNDRWWRIPIPEGRLSEETAEALRHLFGPRADSHVAVREPEVWRSASRWLGSEYYDGRLLTGAEAISLIDEMLVRADFWCRLVTDLTEVHVVEEAIYLTTARPEPERFLPAIAEQVGSSPYDIDRENFPYYPPADEEFWAGLRQDLGSRGEGMLMLQQWAAGFGGECWYWIASTGDLETLRQNAIPRAVYAVFRSPRMVRKKGTSEQPVSAAVGEEPLLGNVRVFRDVSEAPLNADHVANDQELAQLWESLGAQGALFLWTDDAAVSYAAQPDADGRVRAAGSFQ
jgi:hypothetical protein